MFIKDRADARDYFYQVWEKLDNQSPLQPLEAVIADVIMLHPEYHSYLNDREQHSESDFKPEQNQTNPFLHMGMHIALKEQINADRPNGISNVYKMLVLKYDSVHDVEHRMMECLGQSLWEAQRDNVMPDENRYLDCLKKLS